MSKDKQLIRGLREPGDLQTTVVEHRTPSPLATLMETTAEKLRKFFGNVELVPLPPEFTEVNLAKWSEFNLKPVFLPDEEIGPDRRLKGWTKPEHWFYDQIRENKLASDSATLHQGWYLADFTPGVDYTDGTQVFPDDPLAPIIVRLRQEKKVGQHDNTPPGSRFSITHDEWQTVVLPAIANHLGFNPGQVRLERAVEFNAIGNLYAPNRGKFNMWEWFHDHFEGSYRLSGGLLRYGGLAGIFYVMFCDRVGIITGRSLVSFVK